MGYRFTDLASLSFNNAFASKDQEKKIEADLTNLKSETTTIQEQEKRKRKRRRMSSGFGSNHPIFPTQALTFGSWMSWVSLVQLTVERTKEKKILKRKGLRKKKIPSFVLKC